MTVRAWRSLGLTTLAGVLFLLAATAMVAGVVIVRDSPPSGPALEIGKWLLQLGTVLAGTGFITAMLRQAEVSRARREAWTAILQDLVVSQDALEGSVMRVITGPDAESYTALIERCREMRAMLRRMMALPDVTDHRSELRRHANQVRHCLKPTIKEYEDHYLQISRRALLDEKRLEAQLLEMANDDAKRELPDRLFRPSSVGRLLRNAQEFPALAAILRDFDEREIQFQPDSEIDRAYEGVKAELRKNARIYRKARPGGTS